MPKAESRLERQVLVGSAASVLSGILLGLVLVHEEGGVAALQELGVLAATSLLLLGKFVIFLGLDAENPSPWALAVMVWLIDVVLAFALSSGLETFERAPVLGPWLRRARARALLVLERYPGLERLAFFGVVAFVLLPLAATGAITGSFAARIVGLSRIAGILAISIGSAGTAVSFALLAELLGERAADLASSPILTGVVALILLVLGRSAYLRVRGRLRT